MINEAALAMEYGASCEDVARVCHAHPVRYTHTHTHTVGAVSGTLRRGLRYEDLSPLGSESSQRSCKQMCLQPVKKS